jgi:hypothetical protein
MSKTVAAVLIILAGLLLAAGFFVFGAMFGHMSAFGPARNAPGFYGPREMMRGFGQGPMGRNGWNNNRGYGPGMMHPFGYNQPNAAPLSVDQARAAAQKYLAALNNPDLAVAEVMVFSNNAYVAVKETSTGKGAFELLVDPASQVAYPEPGPNMMWNVKYGAMNHQRMMGGYGGMMGYGWNGAPPAGSAPEMSVTSAQAVQYAQKYLDAGLAGATAASDPLQFYGYYTLDFSQNGKVAGMLSVNGYTGQVFLHTWHGAFVEEAH